MSAIQFIQTNPAVTAYDQRMAAMQQQDQQAEQAMQNRVRFDQAQRADRALGSAIDRVVAGVPGAATPTPAPAAAPTPAASLTTSTAPEGAVTPPAVPSPAAAGAPAAAPSAGPVRFNRSAIAREIGNVPGTGQMRFNLVSQQAAADEERSHKVADKVYDLIKANNPASLQLAQQLAQQNNIQIPPQVFTDAVARARLVGVIDHFHKLGLKGRQIPEFFKNYQASQAATEEERMIDASGKVSSEPKVVRTFETAQGVFGVTETGETVAMKDPATGKQLMPTARRMDYAPSRGGAGGGNTVFEKKHAAWLKVHPGDEQGALEYASGRRQVNPAEVKKWAMTMAQRDRSADTRRWSDEQFQGRVQNYIQELQGGEAQPPAAAPAPTTPSGAAAPTPAPSQSPAAGGGPKPAPARANALPRAANGKIDAAKLVDGQSYDVNGVPRAWNAARKTFVKVQ